MSTLRPLALIAVLSLILISAAGCLLVGAAAAGGATYFYIDGEVTTSVEGSPPQVIEAAKLAMKDLSMPVIMSQADGLEGRLEARLGTENKAVIKVRFESQTSSKVRVRIGTFGDETQSRQIIDRIRANMPKVAGPRHAGNL